MSICRSVLFFGFSFYPSATLEVDLRIYVVGNTQGYAAREFARQGLKHGELAIISNEPAVCF